MSKAIATPTPTTWNAELEEMVRKWLSQSGDSKTLHYDAHRKYFHLHYRLGIPVVCLTAITSTAFFASLGKSLDSNTVLLCGFISVFASVFAALQTFFRYAERSEQHRVAAAQYGKLTRDIAYVLAKSPGERGPADEIIGGWKRELGTLADQSPVIAPKDGLDPANLF
jgi:hypothetical protein